MTRDFRDSHTWGDYASDAQRLRELAQPPVATADHPLRAEIGRNSYGGYYVWLRGWGYPAVKMLPNFEAEPRSAEDALDALVAQGYQLQDPSHLIDLFNLFNEPISQYEDNRDATEAPGAYIGDMPGDNGHGAEF